MICTNLKHWKMGKKKILRKIYRISAIIHPSLGTGPHPSSTIGNQDPYESDPRPRPTSACSPEHLGTEERGSIYRSSSIWILVVHRAFGNRRMKGCVIPGSWVENVTSNTVAHCSTFRLFVVNIVLQ